ncbi:tyrosine-type recombinase/integrase [Streptomyces broussonetiae]|uniref:Tyrosine-type recombinase/integrase n=1 Tax=Streptomyces broussonetiae TaxID=2686304 RepID=A0A6I6MX43_9ACTN|nr:tyrosine-type recombinase/integrase [Streptomyces broussonetiae]QHA02170.1 tyrosine-type recombinase/integrase [Streptomyces broussonetiae]
MSVERLERLEPESEGAADLVVYEGELLDVADTAAPVRYIVNQHTMLAPGEHPPRADEQPVWGEHEFRLTDEDVADLDEPDLAENTVINRDSTVRAFEAWCAQQKPPHRARPCTTTTYTRYGLHLIRLGKAGKYVPDSVGTYMSRIWNWQPVDLRPDPSHFKARLRAWRREWVAAGGEVRRAPAVTIGYNLRIINAIDETTNIGKRDAFLAALAYANLHREMELADQLVKRVRVHPTGLFVTTAMSKTDQTGKGAGRFIKDREDLQLVRRAQAWLDVLRELGANGPDDPLFRALTKKGQLVKYPEDRKRGKKMRPGSLNERLQVLADRAGVPYIDGKKVTSHSWRAGANTDLIEAGVSLQERNRAGRWADGSKTADTVYDRPHGVGTRDPLAAVPLYGGPAHAAVQQARAEETEA